jgi:eukaryotic-like serine/threonine-protein kinase
MPNPNSHVLPPMDTVLNGKYRLIRVLGKGGAGQVVEAEHLRLRTTVALKFMLPTVASDPDTVARFEREARAMARISSRHVVRVLDVETTTDGLPFVVMEFLSGVDLHAHLRVVRSIEPLEAVQIVYAATLGVIAMHQAGVVHRDLKPANLFLAKEGDETVVKVVDFGISKIVGEGEEVTVVGTSMGTPSYMSPEQVMSSRDVDHRSDVWSLGIILFRLIAGRPPFEQVGGSSMIGLILTAEPMSLCELVPTAPRAVEAIIQRALAKEPNDRYPSAEAFADALAELLDFETGSGPRSKRGNTWRNASTSASAGEGTLSSAISTPSGSPASTFGAAPVSMRGGFGAAAPSGLPELDGAVPTQPSPALGRAASSAGSRGRLAVVAGASLIAVGGAVALFVVTGPARHGASALPSARPGGEAGGAPDRALALASGSVSAAAVATPPKVCPAGMATVPAGKFFIGVDEAKAMDREKPRHQVMLSAYCIDVTEVTVEAYKAASDQGETMPAPTAVAWPKITPGERKTYDGVCNAGVAGRERHPVNCVNWAMADLYCRSQKKRLPTSAEWEFASRGPDGRMYPWGDELPDAQRLNACGKECVAWGRGHGVALHGFHQEDDGFPTTAPVGSFPKGRSRYGLDDVIGNVMEWVQDWDAPYTTDAVTDPQGPASGEERVIRGGAWNAESDIWVRPSFRYSFPPDTRSHGVGFRCAASL